MSNIPPDIYERVAELALAMVNASGAGDEALNDSLYQSLRVYFEEQEEAGRSHPFLTEAMADFTHDPVESIRLYRLALKQASALDDEPKHTKMICLARNLIELGRKEEAEAYLRDGRAEAVRRGDTRWIRDADEMLRDLSG